MAKIRITPETLESQAKELRGKKDQHTQIYESIKTHVGNLVNEWEGQAQQAFLDSFRQRDAQFRKFAEDIETFATLMDTAAREMRSTDESLTSKMRI